ncbi:Hypothetical protein, putative [Bodo saltans]|uniref:Uncharacterized protein n=1 Tax=Bodo saltans TaxID=75058 RepID=A0A0S4IUL7_BODSA|nr:Hypothetical protein, putative [Bodo saltans]|eukprot:CUG12070.1 Hypothetical protein, putative [Bodo saltans]
MHFHLTLLLMHYFSKMFPGDLFFDCRRRRSRSKVARTVTFFFKKKGEMAPLYCARCKNAFCSRALLAKHVCTPPDAEPKTEEVEDETVSDNEQTTDSVESENEKKLRTENHQRKPKGGDKRESYAPKADLTAHDEQTHATNRVTAIESEILSIRAEVSNMKSVLHAMEAAQVGDACAPGFDGRKFALLTPRQQRNEEQFDKDIRAKEDDIRRKEEDIRKFQDDIRSLRQQEVGQRPKPHQSGRAQQSNFRNVQDAFDAISQQPDAQTPESVELSMAVKRCNVTATTNGLIDGVRILMKGFVEPCDQAFVPLMCVLGVSCQGKTDTLNFIRRDANVHALVIEEINKHIKLMKPRPECKQIVPLFATFNQSRTFNGEKEPTIGSALCNRLLSNHLGVIFDPRQSPRFDDITLRGLTEFIRQREATERRCTPAEISIIILVDEMQQVMKGAERDDMMDVLKLICTVQHVALINSAAKDLTFAVVSSVDVDGIHDRVDKCGRPLHSIPLSPCSVEDIDDMVDTMVDFEVQNNNLEPMAAGDARRELRWAAHATGGHFRSLEKLWLAFRENPYHFTQAQAVIPAPRTSANILDVIAHRLHDPLWLREETIRIGAAFSKQGVSMPLYDAAMSDVEGVFYEATDAKWGAVVPRVMPNRLSERLPFEGDTDVAQGIVKLWGKMRKLLTSVGRADATNGWEVGLPLLEVIASTLIYEVNGKKPLHLATFGEERMCSTGPDANPSCSVGPWGATASA